MASHTLPSLRSRWHASNPGRTSVAGSCGRHDRAQDQPPLGHARVCARAGAPGGHAAAAAASDQTRALPWAGAVSREARETMMAVAFIARFFLFVAAILIAQGLRGMGLGLAGNAARQRYGAAASGRAIAGRDLPGQGSPIEQRGLPPAVRSPNGLCG